MTYSLNGVPQCKECGLYSGDHFQACPKAPHAPARPESTWLDELAESSRQAAESKYGIELLCTGSTDAAEAIAAIEEANEAIRRYKARVADLENAAKNRSKVEDAAWDAMVTRNRVLAAEYRELVYSCCNAAHLRPDEEPFCCAQWDFEAGAKIRALKARCADRNKIAEIILDHVWPGSVSPNAPAHVEAADAVIAYLTGGER